MYTVGLLSVVVNGHVDLAAMAHSGVTVDAGREGPWGEEHVVLGPRVGALYKTDRLWRNAAGFYGGGGDGVVLGSSWSRCYWGGEVGG